MRKMETKFRRSKNKNKKQNKSKQEINEKFFFGTILDAKKRDLELGWATWAKVTKFTSIAMLIYRLEVLRSM